MVLREGSKTSTSYEGCTVLLPTCIRAESRIRLGRLSFESCLAIDAVCLEKENGLQRPYRAIHIQYSVVILHIPMSSRSEARL